MKILSVTSEMYPLVKTGGLADVAGALPLALNKLGVEMRTVLPGYDPVLQHVTDAQPVLTIPSLFGEEATVLDAVVDGRRIYVVECPGFFRRAGGPYADISGQEWPDNWLRFAALSKAAAMIAEGAIKDWVPDVVHAHDWQAAMTLAYLRHGQSPTMPTVITIHNLAFQGRFGFDIFDKLELPPQAWNVDGVEYYGGVGYLKAGLVYADAITTVSPTYADEIREHHNGMGLDGLLNGRSERLNGILNGIDNDQWDPSTDPHIKKTYTHNSIGQKQTNKRDLAARMGLDKDDSPILVVISRLTWQKGMDLLAEVVDDIVRSGMRLAVLGTGDRMLEGAFLYASDRHRGRVGVRIGYDEAFAHALLAGGDGILIPSRFEPCGLTQLYGLRYGCVPVVSRVGGLADTVVDANEAAIAAGAATGFQFSPPDTYHLRKVIDRFSKIYAKPPQFKAIQRAGMKTDNAWSNSASRYIALYENLIEAQSQCSQTMPSAPASKKVESRSKSGLQPS